MPIWPERPSGGTTEHAIGGASHSSSTLAELNTKLSDATLDDAGDARPPTAHGHAQSDVTNLVTDLAAKETPAGAQAKVDAHKDEATGVHGAGASTLATTANIATHAGLASSIHGFDASGNAPAQSHANEKHSTAMALASDLSTHAGLTTTAHGGVLPSTSFSGLTKITVGSPPGSGNNVGDLCVDTS